MAECGQHRPGDVHLDEAHWSALADQAELEGEVLLDFVTETARWVAELRGSDARPVRLVVDIGSGPGVGTCELARRFPDAQVIAVDSSPAMLDRVERRAAADGLRGRISTQLAELPGGLDGIGTADVIWASMSLHHVGDEVAALRALHGLLDQGGLLAIAERAEPTRLFPDDPGVGRPGLADRLDGASEEWFASMRAGLPDAVPSVGLGAMVAVAGFEVVAVRTARVRLDPPLSGEARRFALGQLRQAQDHLSEHLEKDDLDALGLLMDLHDPRSVLHRADAFVASSRQILVARPIGRG
jgi:SAM-dependent methyltransferase